MPRLTTSARTLFTVTTIAVVATVLFIVGRWLWSQFDSFGVKMY